MLATVYIPETVNLIEQNAFKGCSLLTIYGKSGSYASTYAEKNSIPFIDGDMPDTEITMETSENWEYLTDGINVILTAYSGNDTEIIIPKEIDSKRVIGVKKDLLVPLRSTLTSVTIEAELTSLPDYFFSNCYYLESVVLPDCMVDMGRYTFNNCHQLKNIHLPVALTEIGEHAFLSCLNLETIEIPDGVKTIGWGAFNYCQSLRTVQLPDGLKEIGDSAFYQCTKLEEIEIPDSVKTIYDERGYIQSEGIDNSAFYGCSSLRRVKLPVNLEGIVYSLFSGCTSLKDITIPETVKYIDSRAFYGCGSLRNIKLPEALTEIGESAFQDCLPLINLSLNSSVTSIGKNAFKGDPFLILSCINNPYAVSYAQENNLLYATVEMSSKGVTATLEEDVLSNMEKQELVIETDTIRIECDANATTAIKNASSANNSAVTISTMEISKGNTGNDAQDQIIDNLIAKGCDVYENSLVLNESGEPISFNSNGSGFITLTVPYSATAGEVPGVVCIDENGQAEEIQSSYDSGEQLMSYTTQHLSVFVIGDRKVLQGINTDQQEADRVAALISELPTTVTVADQEKIELASSAYDALTDTQKALVPAATKTKLTNAVTALQEALERQIDQQVADEVVALITNLPAKVTVSDEKKIEAARDAFDALTNTQKGLVPTSIKTKLTNAEAALKNAQEKQADKEAAESVEALITALPTTIAVSDKEKIEAARAAYDALTSAQKVLVPAAIKTQLENAETALKTAQEKQADKEAAERVEALITALPATVTVSDKEQIGSARAAYDGLTSAQKALVPATIKTQLENAEAALKTAQEKKADKEAVDKVEALIKALPAVVTVSDWEKIILARAAFDALTSTQKALVPAAIKTKLTNAEAVLQEALESQTDAESAERVSALIKALPTTVAVSDKENIETARAAYNALTNAQKALVPAAIKTKLENAEAALKTAQEKQKDQQAADRVVALIDALPAMITVESKNVIEAARKAYDDLTISQKKLIPAAILNELEKAEKDLTDAKTVDAVVAQINTLPSAEKAGVNDREALNKAKEAYDKLTDAQKELIKDAKAKLDAVEEAVKEAEKKTEDEIAANAVADLIDALQSAVDKKQIEAARSAYNSLTADQKVLLPKAVVDKLEQAEQDLADAEVAQVVVDLIDALPATPSTSDEYQIEVARTAYNNLTSEQKKLVPETAVNQLVKAEQGLVNAEVAEQFTTAVNAVPGNKAGEGKALLDKVTAIYQTLTADQKAIITQETLDLYDEEVAAFKKGRKFRSGDGYYRLLSNGDVTYLYPADKSVKSAVVPNQVKKGKFLFKVIKISTMAFDGCENLKWIVIHKNIRVLGDHAFSGTKSLKRIRVMGTGFTDGKVVDAFLKAGSGSGRNYGAKLKVKVPASKVKEYEALFKGEGKLNMKATVTAAA